MKKLLALPFKIVALPLFIAALLILVIGGLILNGREKTNQKLSEFAKVAKAMNNLNL
jgi:hypothetical protein